MFRNFGINIYYAISQHGKGVIGCCDANDMQLSVNVIKLEVIMLWRYEKNVSKIASTKPSNTSSDLCE